MYIKTQLILSLLMAMTVSALCDTLFPSTPKIFVERTLAAKPLPKFTRKRIEYARRQREENMKRPLCNIVDGKKLTPKSGNPHDYISTGPYWWPNPDTPNGLPFIRKDGQVNPSYHDGDNVRMTLMTKTVQQLAVLWYFDKDEEAAARAVAQLKGFFLDEATRMNPHFNYGQAIPGICDGRCYGLIEAYTGLGDVLDAIVMLKDAPTMTAETYAALVAWFRQFHTWLNTSSIGKKEFEAPNNHGLACYVQAVKYAIFIGDMEAAKAYMPRVEKLICKSVDPDGSLPRELVRTKSFSYSTFATGMMTQLVLLGKMLDYDLLDSKRESADAIRRAVLFLCGFIDHPEAWKHQQIGGPINPNALSNILARMSAATGDPIYLDNLKKLTKPSFDVMNDLFIAPEF